MNFTLSRLLRLSLIVTLFALTISVAQAQSETKPLLVGCEPEYPPYCSVTTNGQASGFSIDLLTAALEAINLKAQFTIALWDDLKADCALVYKNVAHFIVNENAWMHLHIPQQVVFSSEACYATLQVNDLLRSQFDEGLEILKRTGKLRAIRTKWLSPYETTDFRYSALIRNIVLAALVLLLLLLGAILWSHALRKTVIARTRELNRNNALLRAQTEASIDGILAVDEKRLILSSNQRFRDLWHLPPDFPLKGYNEELLNHTSQQLVDPNGFLAKVEQIYNEPQCVHREELIFKNGQVLDRYTAPITSINGTNIGRVWFFRDITESRLATQALCATAEETRRLFQETELARRSLLSVVEDQKNTEDLLRESEERFRNLYNRMNEGVALMRLIYNEQGKACDYTIESLNPAFERIMKKSAQELIGHRSVGFSSDGQALFLDVFSEVAQSGQPANLEYTHDETGRILALSISSPGPDRFATVVEDITERKRLAAQLDKLQRIESIGRLAGGIAHDFNNMLSVILGNTELALDSLEEDAPSHADLLEIRDAALRAADLTRQLLAFARKQTVVPRIINLNCTIEEMMSMMRRLLGEDIEFVWEPHLELWPISIDPSQIDQILTNLCVNAREAIEGVGKLIVKTENASYTEEYCQKNMGFEPGAFALITVTDTGCGMTQEVLNHLFEPFYSSKALGVGSGLGLATVFGIVKQNNGFITVASTPGQGSTFKIGFPRYGGSLEGLETGSRSTQISARSSDLSRGGNESILLVEDEPAILGMTQTMLRKLGYQVKATGNPHQALELATKQKEPFDLILTDIIMKEMNGVQLATMLKKQFPDIKCLYMSGFTANVIKHQGILDERTNFIQKPFSMKSLSTILRTVLDNPNNAG